MTDGYAFRIPPPCACQACDDAATIRRLTEKVDELSRKLAAMQEAEFDREVK